MSDRQQIVLLFEIYNTDALEQGAQVIRTAYSRWVVQHTPKTFYDDNDDLVTIHLDPTAKDFVFFGWIEGGSAKSFECYRRILTGTIYCSPFCKESVRWAVFTSFSIVPKHRPDTSVKSAISATLNSFAFPVDCPGAQSAVLWNIYQSRVANEFQFGVRSTNSAENAPGPGAQ